MGGKPTLAGPHIHWSKRLQIGGGVLHHLSEGVSVLYREWLASGRGTAMFVALLLSFLAGPPLAARADPEARHAGYEQLARHNAAFVQGASAPFKKAAQPSPSVALLAPTGTASAQQYSYPFCAGAPSCRSSHGTQSAAPYLARAPPAA